MAQAFGSARSLVCPYSRQWYRYGSSGIHNEAIANGIPSVVPAGTTLSATADEFGGASVTFGEDEPGSILKATRHALDNFEHYAEAAQKGAAKWREINGPSKIVDALVATHRHRHLSGSGLPGR